MGWPRLSLASLMGLVAVIALGLTGLFSSSTFWTSVAAALTLALLLGALLGAWLLLGTARAFCLGFALFGIVFFVLVEWDWVGGQFGHDLTSGLLDLGEALIARPAIATPAIATGAPIRVSSEPWAARPGSRWQLRANQPHGSVAWLRDAGRLPRQDLQRSPAGSAQARRTGGFLTMRGAPGGLPLSETRREAGSCIGRSSRKSGQPTAAA